MFLFSTNWKYSPLASNFKMSCDLLRDNMLLIEDQTKAFLNWRNKNEHFFIERTKNISRDDMPHFVFYCLKLGLHIIY